MIELLESSILNGILSSKNIVRRVMNKINIELSFIEKIVVGFKEVYVMNKIEEADEIVVLVDVIIENVEKYV